MNDEIRAHTETGQQPPGKVPEGHGTEMAPWQGDVDVSQIDELLTLTPTERLLRHEQALILVEELRRAGREFYGFDPRAVILEGMRQDLRQSPSPG